MSISDEVQMESIFRVGEVISVDGRSVKIKVDKNKNTSSLLYKGIRIPNVSVGGYIKVSKGFIDIIGKVEGEFVSEIKSGVNSYHDSASKIDRVLVISLLGFIEGGGFERGIKEMPLIGNECFLLKKEEFLEVHKFVEKEDQPLTIGHLSLEKGQKINIGVNALIASHIGIFGNTGSGKSYTLAKIYHEIFKTYKDRAGFRDKAQFFFIDFNGEYVRENSIIDAAYKKTYTLSTRIPNGDKLPILSNSVKDSAFWIIFLDATEKTQSPFLTRALKDRAIEDNIRTEELLKNLISEKISSAITQNDQYLDKSVVTDFLAEMARYLEDYGDNLWSPYHYFTENLKYHGVRETFYIDDVFANGNPAGILEIVKEEIGKIDVNVEEISELKKIGLCIIIRYYDEIIRGFSNREHLSPLIKRLDKRIDDMEKVLVIQDEKQSDKNINIISLSDVNVAIKKIIPLVLCKEIYEQKKIDQDKTKYLNIIIDEAHNILSESSVRESEQWKDYRLETFEEIIKEGRKFGVFLTVSSQRPADISATILSQLHNYFLHRLINNKDIQAVERTISYLDKVSFEYLPILPTGTCILAGLVANIPVILDVDELEKKYEPDNKTIQPLHYW